LIPTGDAEVLREKRDGTIQTYRLEWPSGTPAAEACRGYSRAESRPSASPGTRC